MSSPKQITLEQAIAMITNLHETTYKEALEILTQENPSCFESSTYQIMLIMWFEAALIANLINRDERELAESIREYRLQILVDAFGIDRQLLSNILDNYPTTQSHAAKFGINNFMLNHLMLFIETPEEQVILEASKYGIMPSMQFSELMIRHGKVVAKLVTDYRISL